MLKLLFILFSSNVFALEIAPVEKKEMAKTLTLGIVDGESDDLSSVVTARFNQNLIGDTPQIEDHGTFLQIKLPGVLIPESGKFIDVKSPYITKIATFQVNESTGALRLFLNNDAAVVKQASKAEVLGDRLLITLDHNKLAQLVSKPGEVKSAEKTAEQFVKTAEVKSEIIEQEKKIESAPGIGSSLQTLQLGEKMTMAAIFSAVMIFGLLGSLTIRKLKRKKFNFENAEEEQASIPVKMKLLSSMAVVGKQRLSLVQVGDQQILLSVSPESITYIATIPKKGQTFGDHLLNENAPPPAMRAPLQQQQLRQHNQPSIPVRQVAPKLRAPVASSGSQPQIESQGSRVVNRVVNGAVNSTLNSATGAKSADSQMANNSQYEDISKAIRERLKKLPHI